MGEQLALPFGSVAESRGYPTWDDVQKGRAEYYTLLVKCDRCAGLEFGFGGYWNAGRCWHTADRYAFPKKQPNGMCRRGRLRWVDA